LSKVGEVADNPLAGLAYFFNRYRSHICLRILLFVGTRRIVARGVAEIGDFVGVSTPAGGSDKSDYFFTGHTALMLA
jgi:hypothetical protein